jgi:nucleotide-binding universal stress UspA family protein
MSNDRAIVVGVDGRPDSAGALRYAAVEARRRQAPLRLVHVVPGFLTPGAAVPPRDPTTIGRSVVEQALATVHELDPGLASTTVLLRGDRSAGIVKIAESSQLVVIGRETRRGLDRLLTGTTTAGVAAQAPCDIVVVPPSWDAAETRGQVAVGLKGRRDSRELLARAFTEAAVRDATLRVVHAWELADPYLDRTEQRAHAAEWEANGRDMVLEVIAEWRAAYPDVPVETRIVHGSPIEVLMEASRTSDLLVISRRHFALPPYGRLGGVGHALLRLSDAPVHVVPYLADEAREEPLVLEADGVPLKSATGR